MKECFACLILAFLLDNSWLLGVALSSQVEYIYILTLGILIRFFIDFSDTLNIILPFSPSSNNFLFSIDGCPYRKPQLVDMQRTNEWSCPFPTDKSIMRFPYLISRNFPEERVLMPERFMSHRTWNMYFEILSPRNLQGSFTHDT